MKISQIIEEESDLNNFDYRDLWFWHNEAIKKIDLSTLTVDSSVDLNPRCYRFKIVKIYNNHFIELARFLHKVEPEEYLIDLLILEGDDLNAKEIEKLNPFNYSMLTCVYCTYDLSLFTFGSNDTHRSSCLTKSCIILEKSPIMLSTWDIGIPYSYMGHKQKIWITTIGGKVSIYDIVLDSYSEIESLHSEGLFNSLFVSDGKIYMIERAIDYKIYIMDDQLLEWILVFTSYSNISYEKCARLYASSPYAYCNRMIYFFRKHILYEFNLKNSQSRAIGYLNDDESLVKF